MTEPDNRGGLRPIPATPDVRARVNNGAAALAAYALQSGTAPTDLVQTEILTAAAIDLTTGVMCLAEQSGMPVDEVLRHGAQRYSELTGGPAAEPDVAAPEPHHETDETAVTDAAAEASADQFIDRTDAAASTDELADRAAAAVAAYSWRTRGFPHVLGNEPDETALLGDLIGDLQHVTGEHGIAFPTAITAASRRFEALCAEENLPYRVGDLVKISDPERRQKRSNEPGRAQRGWVTAVLPRDAAESRYVLSFPGERIGQQFRPDELTPAPTFPSVMTGAGAVSSPAAAQNQLVEIFLGRIENSRTAHGATDHQNLMDTLVGWSEASKQYLTSRLPPAPATGQNHSARPSPAQQAAADAGPPRLGDTAERTPRSASSTTPSSPTSPRRHR